MPDPDKKNELGAVVKAQTHSLQKASSGLVRRGIDDIERLLREEIPVAKALSPRQTNLRLRRKLTILLSPHLNANFQELFKCLGFDVVWAADLDELRKLASENKIDIALEWQWGENDFPVRDMLRQIGKQVPLIMSRNYRRWNDETQLKAYGYDVAIDVPFTVADLIEKCEQLLMPQG